MKKTNECSRCGAKPRHDREKCPAKQLKCRKCKLVGHFAKFCRTRKINTVDADSAAQSEESEYTFMQVRSVNSVHANKPYHVDLKISNEDLRFKIDTGADETIISLEDYNMKLRKKNKIGKKQCSLGRTRGRSSTTKILGSNTLTSQGYKKNRRHKRLCSKQQRKFVGTTSFRATSNCEVERKSSEDTETH
jgi:hypothetical protein